MNGSTNVNAAGRSHYASAIPVPRSFSPGKLQSMAASPKLSQRQASVGPASPALSYSSQKTSSPRPVKATINANALAPKNTKLKCASRTPTGTLEKRMPVLERADLPESKQADGHEGSLSPCGGSPWNSPRLGQKNSSRTREAFKKTLAYGTEKDNESEGHQKPIETPAINGNKKSLGKSSVVSSLIADTSQIQGKATSRFSLYTETVLHGSIEALKVKRPQSCPVKGQWVSEVNWKTQEGSRVLATEETLPTNLPCSGFSQPNGHSSPNKGATLNSGTVSFSSVMPQTPPVTATVAPFQYRLQQADRDGDDSDDDYDDSFALLDVTELSFMDLGEMLGSNLKGSHHAMELGGEEGAEDLKGYKKSTAEGKAMMQKRAKPAGVQRAGELRVFKSGSVDTKLPPGSNLRKQKSLTNLSFMTDAEKKMQLYEPRWCDDMSRAAQGYGKGAPKPRDGPTISKTLSKSEHSLFQGKLAPGLGKPPLAPSSSQIGKPSRIPRGPYAEVKPLTKAPDACLADDVKSDDEILSSKAKAQQNQNLVAGKGQDDKAFLKVDPELVVTVLGDLEQLLFSQMLEHQMDGEPHSRALAVINNPTTEPAGKGSLQVPSKRDRVPVLEGIGWSLLGRLFQQQH